MSADSTRLFELLPALYRIRDLEMAGPGEAGPLKALLSVIAEQIAVLEEDLEQLYDDQFIETCAEWVVPYIGDLVGARSLFVYPGGNFSQRAQVANTLAYRRRKGTAAVLEQLARDVTQWDASVVEYFERLATTQYMNHIRPGNTTTPHLCKWEPLERIGTPFDTVARTVDVRRIENGGGRHNIPNVGIFLWRLGSFSVTDAPAFKVDDRRYLFDALGRDTPLYYRPGSEDQITHLAEPVNVPMPMSRRVLHRDVKDLYGAGKSLSLQVNGLDIDSDKVRICNLSDAGSDWANKPAENYAIDPALGRIVLPEGQAPGSRVRVTYHHGFSTAMGGGEYGRAATFAGDVMRTILVPSQRATLQAALDELASTGGVVEIENSDYYLETPHITVAEGKTIELRAADHRRPVLVLNGALLISGGAGAQVVLNGLLVSGGTVRVPKEAAAANQIGQVTLRHCTLPPGASPAIGDVPAQPSMPRLIVEAANVKVDIERSIVGAIRSIDAARVRISNSIVDALDETATAFAAPDGVGAGATLIVINSTVIGRVHALILELVSNSIFLADRAPVDPTVAPVLASRLQEGCVRFSYVPPESRVPRRFHCQPAGGAAAARVRPVFTSLRHGDAAYCQLSERTAVEVRQGADDEAEMGAFHDLYQPQRRANLRARLDEYLRVGLEAGIFYAS
jgi:hypothetical protein